MSDFHDHHGDPDYERDRGYEWDGRRPVSRSRRGLFSLLIVIAAVGAFCLLIWFVYTQGRRAGTEVVAPVIHADAGPTKVKPESPGGMDVPNQDRLIYERLRNDKDGGDGVEHLLPPPETPMDRPQAPPPAPAQTARADDEEAAPPSASGPSAAGPTGAPAAAPAATPPAVPAPSQATARSDAASVPTVPPAASAPAPVRSAPVPAPAPVPQLAPRPVPPRPEVAKAEAAKAEPPRPVPAPVPTAPVLTPPTSAPPATGGALRLQFASVPSDTQAVAEAQRIQRKHAAVLGGVALHIVRADLGAKGIYYRVQAGPLDEAQARRLCDAVKAGGDNCIPVH